MNTRVFVKNIGLSMIAGVLLWLCVISTISVSVQAKYNPAYTNVKTVASSTSIHAEITPGIAKSKSTPFKHVPKYILKSLFFLPVLLLLCIALFYAVRALQELSRLILYEKNTTLILTTQEAVNDFLAIAMYSLDAVVEKMQNELDSYVWKSSNNIDEESKLQHELHAFKEITGQLLTANQVSGAQSAYTTKQINYSLPKLFKKRQVYLPLIIALGLSMFLNVVLYNFDAIRITWVSGLTTLGVVLFAGLLMALSYRYLCYTTAQGSRNEKKLSQVSKLYIERTKFLHLAVTKLTDGLNPLRHVTDLVSENNLKNILAISTFEKIIKQIIDVEQFSDFNRNAPLFDITAFAHNITEQYSKLFKEKQITFNNEIDSGIVSYVDPNELRRLLESLIRNACEFSLDRGVVTFSIKRRFNKITITILDKGKGISSQKLPGLVKPFAGSLLNDQEMNDKPLGLSLYVDKIIINKLGGNFKITSVFGNGTKVVVQLPIHRSINQSNPLLIPVQTTKA